MEHVIDQTGTASLTKVWSVHEFCSRHRIDNVEKDRLLQLFGGFATAAELLYNVRREPRFR